MGSPRRPHRRALTVLLVALGLCVLGPTVTVVLSLGGITAFATYMDLHGVTSAMRIAVVGAVACVIVPFAVWICSTKRERRDVKAHRARMRALRADTSAHTSYLPRHSADSTSPRGQR